MSKIIANAYLELVGLQKMRFFFPFLYYPFSYNKQSFNYVKTDLSLGLFSFSQYTWSFNFVQVPIISVYRRHKPWLHEAYTLAKYKPVITRRWNLLVKFHSGPMLWHSSLSNHLESWHPIQLPFQVLVTPIPILLPGQKRNWPKSLVPCHPHGTCSCSSRFLVPA